MCGILGIVDPDASRPLDGLAALIEDMARPIRWRGPDDHGTWINDDGSVAFGHLRLSILDLSDAAAQPMRSPSGRMVITYNGEIYNHAEIRAELVNLGCRFGGHGDTEVLLAAVEEWGLADTLERLDGMFAFGLFDRVDRTVTLVRDRLGEKPLYYATMGREVAFASGIDPLRAHPRFDGELDREALCLFLRHKYVPSPLSIYSSIRKLPPGTSVVIGADGAVGEPIPYWDMFAVAERGAAEPFGGSDVEAVDELERLLDISVRRRMVADVPLGAFLSGGLDSTTVVASMAKQSDRSVQTFTIGSAVADFDESTDARRIAGHLGTDHHELRVDGAEALAVVPQLSQIYDEPFADSSQIPTFMVARMAREHVTVSLSGDAGDELFGGYNRYVQVPSVWRRLSKVPMPARRAAASLALAIPPSGWDRAGGVLPARVRPRMLGLKMAKLAEVAALAGPDEMYHRLVSHWDDPSIIVRGGREPLTTHTDRGRWPALDDIVSRMMAIDAVTYLPDDILVKLDRATMAVSLEGRVPFLDRAIVELASTLPLSMKIRDGRTKWIVRKLLERSVPTSLTDRPKSGFGVPIETWLRGPLRGWAEELLFGSDAVGEHLEIGPIRHAWDQHQSGSRNNAYRLWDVLMFASWWEYRS